MKLVANGITIGYDLQGEGPVVTLIHALGLDRGMWWQQVPVLAAEQRALAYDVRGHGHSGKPPGPYSLDLFAADLRALLAALGVDRTHLLGISMGGMIAQSLALQYPKLVASLILADTSSAYDAEARKVFHQRAALSEAEGMVPLVEPTLERWFTAPFRQEHPDIVDRLRQTLLRNDPRAYATAARAVSDLNFTNQLARLRCPTLVIVGEQDAGTPLAMAEVIYRHIRGSLLKVIPQAAHLSTVEQPETFNAAVLEFLRGLR